MKLFLFPNLLSFNQVETTREVIDVLTNELHHEVSVCKEDSQKIYGNETYNKFDISESDYVISLGGDACLLKTAQFAFRHDKPLLGINAGHKGALCAIKKEEIKTLTDNKIRSFKVNDLSVIDFSNEDGIYHSFNEIIIGKKNFGKVIYIDYKINDEEPFSFKGDGLIISTPLGSTGYNYSAGGDIMSKDEASFSLTPICPSFRSASSRKVKDDSVISISSPYSHENKAEVFVDGLLIGELKGMVSISKNKKPLLLLKD